MNPETPEWTMIVARCLIDPIQWERGRDGEFPYQVMIQGRRWEIRVNDFPAEPLYTLMIDGQEALDLEDWPTEWKRPNSPLYSMRRLAAVALVLVTVFALMMGVAMRVGASQALPVRVERQHLADCDLPCWNEITPGSSSASEAKTRIDAALTDFESSLTPTGDKFLFWTEVDEIYHIITILEITIENGAVSSISIGSDHWSTQMPNLREMLTAFGSPTCIINHDVAGFSNWVYENSAHQDIMQFSVGSPSQLSSANDFVFRVSNKGTCQDGGLMSWRDFLASEPAFMANP